MQCKKFQQQLSAYLDETLDESERRAWRQHLGQCTECREWALSQEPTLLFAGGLPAADNPARIEQCVTAVTTLIHHQRLASRLPSRRRRARPWLAAAAAVIIMIAGGMLWLHAPQQSELTPMVELAEPAPNTPPPPPEIEVDMEGTGVRVYHFATAGDDTASATFIVNPALEL